MEYDKLERPEDSKLPQARAATYKLRRRIEKNIWLSLRAYNNLHDSFMRYMYRIAAVWSGHENVVEMIFTERVKELLGEVKSLPIDELKYMAKYLDEMADRVQEKLNNG